MLPDVRTVVFQYDAQKALDSIARFVVKGPKNRVPGVTLSGVLNQKFKQIG